MAGALGALLVLLVSGGAIALLSSGDRERSAPSERQPEEAVGAPEEPKEPTTPVSAPPLEVTTAPESTMSNPEPTISQTDIPTTEDFEAEAEEAAGDYYRAAGLEDWEYTYEHLATETQSRFTREEWFSKNQWFADNAPVTYHILSADLENAAAHEIVVRVSLRLTGEDGSSSIRETYFVSSDDSWEHRFGQEEYDLFMPDVSYEEFVEAQN